jgi:hypothetical protein
MNDKVSAARVPAAIVYLVTMGEIASSCRPSVVHPEVMERFAVVLALRG